jgi:hypothetical protein
MKHKVLLGLGFAGLAVIVLWCAVGMLLFEGYRSGVARVSLTFFGASIHIPFVMLPRPASIAIITIAALLALVLIRWARHDPKA